MRNLKLLEVEQVSGGKVAVYQTDCLVSSIFGIEPRLEQIPLEHGFGITVRAELTYIEQFLHAVMLPFTYIINCP